MKSVQGWEEFFQTQAVGQRTGREALAHFSAAAVILAAEIWGGALLGGFFGALGNYAAAQEGSGVVQLDARSAAFSPDVWRQEKRLIDMHMHVSGRPEYFRQAVGIMDEAGIGVGVELGSGTVTRKAGELSQFERMQQLSAATVGRFVHHMLLDYEGWDSEDWSDRAVAQVVEGKRLGAAGLKEFKRLGLFLRDANQQLIRIDDPKLAAVWDKCGELGLPVSIHVADPKAFWEPLNEQNERWEELRDHPSWWFGDRNKYPPREELLAALARVIARHPQTTFVTVHFANNAEDLEWVDEQLTQLPNMLADVAARIPEVGRHPPERVRELMIKHQDRFVFGSDFMVGSRYILGSAGDDERPTDADAIRFFRKTWRFFETDDRDWEHMTPIQGKWTISSIQLPPEVLRKLYFDNARKLLAHAWPDPVMRARRIEVDFVPDGDLSDAVWQRAEPVRLEYALADATAHPTVSTSVKALWSDRYLYLAFEAPFTELKMAAQPGTEERLGLWDDDVVEAFIGPDPEQPQRYSEYEWAPNGEVLDLKLELPERDFGWQSGMESAVAVDHETKLWRTEVRIPLASISEVAPGKGTQWRLNLYRHDNAHRVFLAWNPTLTRTAHTPEKFGWLEFVE
jgi:predicted TIM-barrel fold metal-dependent hydrolase